MNERGWIVLAGSAVGILGVGALLMARLGQPMSENDDDPSEAAAVTVAPRPGKKLEPTAEYNVTQKTADGRNLIPETSELVNQLNDTENDPMQDLYLVDEVIRFYTSVFSTIPPGGENVDIVRALTGGNAKRLALFPQDHPAINPAGELIDRWGTPYHFHPVSKKLLEIRSAGPDRQLYTEDDLLLGRDS